ncbi:MAG: hypothetical protein ACR2GH_04655 [Pseudonocardia sp.]
MPEPGVGGVTGYEVDARGAQGVLVGDHSVQNIHQHGPERPRSSRTAG